MKIIGKDISPAASVNNTAAVKVGSAARKSSSEAHEHKRDRADFDRELISRVRKIKSSVRSEFDVKQNEAKPSITSGEISTEIERFRSRTKKTAVLSSETETQENAAQNTNTPTGTAAENTAVNSSSGTSTPGKSSGGSEAAQKLAEQKKQIFDLLGKHSGTLSKNVVNQLRTIYKLLGDQEKTDPDSISEGLQKEIDKLAEIIKTEKSDMHKSVSEKLEAQYKKLNSLVSKNAGSDKNLTEIQKKIRQGQKLTAAERRYLSSKDPDAYEKYCKISAARSMFRCSLNNCRTRDEVIGMRLSNALSALSSYKKAIREGGDGSDVIALNAAFENELKSYTRSSSYRSLPTAAECDKFDRDLAKARRYEQEKKLEKQREAQRMRSKRYKKTAKKTKIPGDGKRTVAQVLADPNSKKVLAARAKRTYCECGTVGFSAYKGLNSKA